MGSERGARLDSTYGLIDRLVLTLHTHDQGLRDEQLRSHFGERYLQLVPIINACLQEVRACVRACARFHGLCGGVAHGAIDQRTAIRPVTNHFVSSPQNRIRCMKTETNELVYQAVDPDLAEKMRNLGCVHKQQR